MRTLAAVTLAFAALTIPLLVADAPGLATRLVSAQQPIDLLVKLVVEISDTDNWLAFRESLLAPSTDMPTVATVTVPAQTGGAKSIVLNSVRLKSKAVPNGQSRQVLVTISGTMTGLPALRTLDVFEQAVFQMQAGLVPNDVAMSQVRYSLMTDHVVRWLTLALGIAFLLTAFGREAWQTLGILGDLVGSLVLSRPLIR